MKKNYYEILEISENASQEIVEKAYKTLAMKYHPDLHGEENKANYEEKLKDINEAYEVLKDENKRATYDAELAEKRGVNEVSNMQQSDWARESQSNNRPVWEEDLSQKDMNSAVTQQQEAMNRAAVQQEEALRQEALRQEALRQQEAMDRAYQKAYRDAYVQELKRRGFKIRYKKTPKDYLRIVITFIVIIVLAVLLWQIPFIRNYFIDLYENNMIIHLFLSPFLG